MLDRGGAIHAKIPAAYCYRCPWNLRPETCDVPCADELDKAIAGVGARNVAAFLAEPISGAALGAAAPSDRYWPRIRDICDRRGILLIADEIMTGFGRLGTPLGLDRWKVTADIVALGKGMSSGYLPLAGVLARREIWRPIAEGAGKFEHGFTNHGHPVASAAGLAVIRELEKKKLVSRSARLEPYLREKLHSIRDRFSLIGDIRGAGTLWGIEFVRDAPTREPLPASLRFAETLRRAAFRRGLILYASSGFLEGGNGDHIMIAPPLIVSRPQIDEIFHLLELALEEAIEEAGLRRNPGTAAP
jgi:adenosylmethionine-8-amino-7-oxononanoate aminotransferase